LKRIVVPFAAPHAKRIGKQILSNVAKTGLEVVGDVAAGKSAKESIKERTLSGIKRTVGDIVRQSPINFEQQRSEMSQIATDRQKEKEEKSDGETRQNTQ